MRMKLRFGKWAMRLWGVGFTVAWMAPAAGQQELPVCSKEQEMVGTLGIEQFACGPCSQSFRGGRETWRFDAEPIIQAVR
ncbi:MAG: hypothetical protein PVJ76_19935, partial [Gemmatimonadota bacterium]